MHFANLLLPLLLLIPSVTANVNLQFSRSQHFLDVTGEDLIKLETKSLAILLGPLDELFSLDRIKLDLGLDTVANATVAATLLDIVNNAATGIVKHTLDIDTLTKAQSGVGTEVKQESRRSRASKRAVHNRQPSKGQTSKDKANNSKIKADLSILKNLGQAESVVSLNVSGQANISLSGSIDLPGNVKAVTDATFDLVEEVSEGTSLNTTLGIASSASGEISINGSTSTTLKQGMNDHDRGNTQDQRFKARQPPRGNEYYIALPIGTPAQTIHLIPDTGSSDLFLWCSSETITLTSSFFPPNSTTYWNASIGYSNYYADGTGGDGWIGSDTISIEGDDKHRSGDGMTSFFLATVLTDEERDTTGVLGLGLDGSWTMRLTDEQYGEASKEGLTFFTRLIRKGIIDRPILGIRLVKRKKEDQAVSKGSSGSGVVEAVTMGAASLIEPVLAPVVVGLDGSTDVGSMVFGEVESQWIRGGEAGLTWVDVTSRYYWGSLFDDVYVGQEALYSSLKATPKRFIIDTGTTLIFTTYELSSHIHARIPHSFQDPSTGIYYVPCDISFPRVPNLFWQIGGKRWGVPVEDLRWRESIEEGKEGMCISAVQGGTTYFTVLGDIFIANRYIALSYDADMNAKIGIGERVDVAPIL